MTTLPPRPTDAGLPPLPIDAALDDLARALAVANTAVLVAPPGAGKTTRVPLALMGEPWMRGSVAGGAGGARGGGKILVLEPRRLAARAAAAHMARTLGEHVGDTVGYRVRFGSRVSRRTRIEVVTEGVFTRLILDDPTLESVAAVLFDEFHERSLDADLGLALARDAQQGLREDLRLLVMSATIDAARIAKALGEAPVIVSEGKAFAVETRYAGRDPVKPIAGEVAGAVVGALRADTGSILAFLPGSAEIRRAETLLRERIADPAVDIFALYGALDADAQDRAIAPAPPGRRKIVLATSIAETSITIDGVRVVIDCGLSRVPRYEPDMGLTRLETVRVSRAAADQRRGRAGRLAPGVCYRLWNEPQTAALAAYGQPEILAADLSGFVLDLARWGVADPRALVFLDYPPTAALKEARALLADLGAIDPSGRITAEGKALNRLPLPPRLGRMVLAASRGGTSPGNPGRRAAEIAAVLTERGLGGNDVDLRHRLDALAHDRSERAEQARRMARQWAAIAAGGERMTDDGAQNGAAAVVSSRLRHRSSDPGALLALAYPERIARNRGAAGGGADGGGGGGWGAGGAGSGAFLLANGRGGRVDPVSPLAREAFLAVAELIGSAAQGRITLAAPIGLADIERIFAERIDTAEEVVCDEKTLALRCRRTRRLGAVTLSEQALPAAPNDAAAALLSAAVVKAGLGRLPWTKALARWRGRVAFLRRAQVLRRAEVLRGAEDEEWPDLSDEALSARAGEWLTPLLAGKTELATVAPDELATALHGLLPHRLRRRLDAEAPVHFDAPSGSRVPIDYDSSAGEAPKLAIRVQELFGLDRHPAVAGGRVPLLIELLSPAHRPVQMTRDLPGFWRGSYAAVKSEMRGRYPRHPWPDDPLAAPPTRRAKPRSE
jgi:ATP-dependent helicase HrpB